MYLQAVKGGRDLEITHSETRHSETRQPTGSFLDNTDDQREIDASVWVYTEDGRGPGVVDRRTEVQVSDISDCSTGVSVETASASETDSS